MTVAPFSSAIGSMVTGHDVEAAALGMLQRWSGTYLAEAERQTEREPASLPRIRAWTTTNEFEKFPEDQLPTALLISPGLIEPPVANGIGEYRAKFSLGLAVIVSANTPAATHELGRLYCAVLRACMLQHQSLEGFARGVEWIDENYDDIPPVDERTLGAGRAVFAVEVDGITRRWGGPPTPSDPAEDDTEELPDEALVEHTFVDTVSIPVQEDTP